MKKSCSKPKMALFACVFRLFIKRNTQNAALTDIQNKNTSQKAAAAEVSRLKQSIVADNHASFGCSFMQSCQIKLIAKHFRYLKYFEKFKHNWNNIQKIAAFSLTEMLMALLVASLLMAALAPVMTKKFSENVNITGNMVAAGGTKHTYEIEYGSEECSEIKTDTDGSEYCEGEFTVPGGYTGYINATVIGAGGGGGMAPAAGFVEFTNAGSTNTFTIPAMTGTIETTLISGGAGGGAGGYTRRNHKLVTNGNGNISQNENNILHTSTNGNFSWTIPDLAKGKYALITACGGGGGGGGAGGTGVCNGGGGGSGGYFVDSVLQMPANGALGITLGGGGGGGGGDDNPGRDGRAWDAGGGGSGTAYIAKAGNGKTSDGGAGGNCPNNDGGYGGKGGSGAANGQDGKSQTSSMTIISGGSGNGYGGKGGDTPISTLNGGQYSGGGGGGGGFYHGGGGGGSGGGSGGGGGSLTRFTGDYYMTASLVASGGGGGGGGTGAGPGNPWNQGGGGGGGAGVPGSVGGNGGNGGGIGSSGFTSQHGSPGMGGKGGSGGSGTTGGSLSTIFGSNYCGGGNGASGTFATGSDGKDGAMRISYLVTGVGGSGGGSGRIHANYPLTVTPNEALKITLGTGGEGGTPAYTNNTGIVGAKEPPCPTTGGTYILRDSTIILGAKALCGNGAYPGSSTGMACGANNPPYYSEGSWIYTKSGNSFPTNNGHSGTVPTGFFSTNGHPAGDSAQLNCNASTIANNTIGGRGGTTTTPFTGTCTPGAGGTSASPNGTNASGYGCGGGGGYGLGNGGKGSGGYARISWNKYWDTANSAYKLAETGAGGGGASGNILTYSISVKSNQAVKFRIGKGGKGAYILNNTVISAKKGGDTVFGDIKAGGGGAGSNVSVNTSGELINGKGGSASNICQTSDKNFINDKKRCTKGIEGQNAKGATGGKGADFAGYKYTVIDKEGNETKKEIMGAGADGGVQDTGNNANGKNANTENYYGAGGGGAAIRDLGQVNSSSQSNITNNPTTGGNGSNGKIILEWYR